MKTQAILDALAEITSLLRRGYAASAAYEVDQLRENILDPRTPGQRVCDKYGAARN